MISSTEKLTRICGSWERRQISIPYLAAGLDQVLEETRDEFDVDTAGEALRIWGVIEIINASILDENRKASPEEMRELDRLVEKFRNLVGEHL